MMKQNDVSSPYDFVCVDSAEETDIIAPSYDKYYVRASIKGLVVTANTAFHAENMEEQMNLWQIFFNDLEGLIDDIERHFNVG